MGSSKIFNNALIELILRNSILSIKTNLGFLLNDDLFKFKISLLIWLMSIFFLSKSKSINMKFGFDPFNIVLNVWFRGFIIKLFKS